MFFEKNILLVFKNKSKVIGFRGLGLHLKNIFYHSRLSVEIGFPRALIMNSVLDIVALLSELLQIIIAGNVYMFPGLSKNTNNSSIELFGDCMEIIYVYNPQL